MNPLLILVLGIISAVPLPLSRLADQITAACLDTENDPAFVLACEKTSDHGRENGSDVRELFLKVPMGDKEMEALIEMQRPDGSWTDIDYKDPGEGFWQPSLHAFRFYRLAVRYGQKGDERALEAALRSLDYWSSAALVCNNWWHGEIGIPRLMGPAFVLLKDRMGPERLKKAVCVMGAASFGQTGQNRVWLAGNVLLRAILEDNESLAAQARDEMLSELRFAPEGNEGLQADYSFHQHGPQFQSGNYGLSFAISLSWWARVLKGTGLDFPEKEEEALRSFVQKGLSPLIWNGWFDPNACSRQVFPNAQSGKALCIAYAAKNLGISLDAEDGGTYFPCSDFGVFRGEGWYASIRMQSSRTIGFETVNDENMKGYFSSDGALMVRLKGNEYDNIWPLWDWHHIPGVTSWDDGAPIWGNRCGKAEDSCWPYNNSEKVSGLSRDGMMIAAMDYNRDSLCCHKAWFFYRDGIICLGTGITKPGEALVSTTIEQNFLEGRICKGKRGVCHRHISYLLLDDSDYSVSTSEHYGQWNWMSPTLPEDQISAPLFEMVINHGTNPSGASYAYAIVPGKGLIQAQRELRAVKVLYNTPQKQSVSIDGKILSVDWTEFVLDIR